MSDSGSVAPLLDGVRVLVVAGAGGVGKTTISAAVATGMAARGLRVAVLTIDPAKRLATALGLDELGNEPRRVDGDLFAGDGLSFAGGGELWAMQLDVKRTFDELVARLAPDDGTREEIFANRIYRELSGAVAGSQEFTAIAKLYELAQTGDYDLLVLDTPPSRNALDFLDAPDRLTQFFEGRALRLLLKPSGFGMRLLGRGTGVVTGLLRRVTGHDLMSDLMGFFKLLTGLFDGFRERATQVEALLADPTTSFLLVTSPEREPIEEAIHFRRKLSEARMSLAGTVVNRVHVCEGSSNGGVPAEDDLVERLVAEAGLSAALARRVAQAYRDRLALARRDAANVEYLVSEVGDGADPVLVPELDGDIHDLAGLVALHDRLFAIAPKAVASARADA